MSGYEKDSSGCTRGYFGVNEIYDVGRFQASDTVLQKLFYLTENREKDLRKLKIIKQIIRLRLRFSLV